MIHFIDQTSEKEHHAVFNACMIKILRKLYPEQSLTHHGIESNLIGTTKLLSNDERSNINYHKIIYAQPIGEHRFFKAINYIGKERKRKKELENIYKKASENDVILLSITTPHSYYNFKRIQSRYSIFTIGVIHGDIDFIYNTSSFYKKLTAYFYKKTFNISSDNFYYLFINKISKTIVVRDGYLKENEILEINHPYYSFPDIDDNRTEPLSFGHIGSMEVERKNSHYIYKIAEQLRDFVENKRISFKVLGLITPGVIPYKNQWIEEYVGNKVEIRPDYLPREDYEEMLRNLNYALFFYQEPEYVHRTSGAIIDAIAYAIPIIALKHPYFNYLFEKAGDIGYLCDDLEEMRHIIEDIIIPNRCDDRYSTQRRNLIEFRNKFGVDYITEDLKNQINIRKC